MPVRPLILASASPRRRELLTAAGLSFTTCPVDIDESFRQGETPEAHVERLARQKAEAALERHAEAVVLGADTVVVISGRVLGKPRDGAEARDMLSSLAGTSHDVLTGIALLSARRTVVEHARTTVWMAPMSAGEIAEYVGSGEPFDKAGAYAIQGLASRFIERIAGNYANVVGLPVSLVYARLKDYPEW